MSKLPLLRVRWSPGATSAALRLHALLFLAAGLTAASAQTYTFTTLAGDASFGSADGTGRAARFAHPGGVAVDGSGNVFVADSNNHTIRKITAGGVVTTVAGSAGIRGSANGTGAAARFNSPIGLAVDGNGNLFVADNGNHAIRKITVEGVVTTFAGEAGAYGSADGPGSVARFGHPSGVAVDRNGSVFVADSNNATIRKITANGVVTTFAGDPNGGIDSDADGTGSAARFGWPCGVAVDANGTVYVVDSDYPTIRKITAGGVVTTLTRRDGNWNLFLRWLYGVSVTGVAVDDSGNVFVTVGSFNGELPSAILKVSQVGDFMEEVTDAKFFADFVVPSSVAVDRSGNLFVADNHRIRKGVGVVIAVPAVTGPQSVHVNSGGRATFTVVTVGPGILFQWKKDGIAIPGATSATYQLSQTATSDMGFYSAVVTTATDTIESSVAILTVDTGTSTSRLSNFSARGVVPAGSDLTVGFAVRGVGGKSVLVRAVGPTLGSFGVSGVLADPKLDVIRAGAPIAANSNDDWGGGAALADAFAYSGAFPLPVASKDAALLSTLAVAGYTARVTSSLAGGSGIVLTEVYDRDPTATTSRVVNISTLGIVSAANPTLALGFVIDGVAPKRLLIRAVGPGLERLGTTGVLDDPQLSVIPLGKTFSVASNDYWGGDGALSSAFFSAGAFALPASSPDAAVLLRLPPGGYTVMVSGVADSVGRALVEIYDLDP